ALALRQRPDARIEQRRQIQLLDDASDLYGVGPFTRGPTLYKEAEDEIQRPADSLCRPRRDSVRQIKQQLLAFGCREHTSITFDRSPVSGQDAAQTFEQRRLAGTIGS